MGESAWPGFEMHVKHQGKIPHRQPADTALEDKSDLQYTSVNDSDGGYN